MGTTRYGDFQSRLPISHSVLSSRLRSLTDDGLLEPSALPDESATLRVSDHCAQSLAVADARVDLGVGSASGCPSMPSDCRACTTPCATRTSPRVSPAARAVSPSARKTLSRSGARAAPGRGRCRQQGPADDPPSSQAGLFPQTMTVLGNRWAFAILVAAFVGMSRFTDFQTQLGAPPGSIADRLSIFTANGVLVVADNRYRLTEKGRGLFPVLITALQWAQRWYPAPEGPAVELTHTACGRPFTAVMTCDQCTAAAARSARSRRSRRGAYP